MLVKINELSNKNSPYFQLGVRRRGTEILEKHGVLDIVDINRVKYVELEKLLKHVEWEKNFIKEHLIDLDVWKLLGSNSKKDSLRSSGIKKLISLVDLGLIDMVELKYPLISIRDNKYKNIKRFFKKSSLECFLRDYIKLNDAKKLMGKSGFQYTLSIIREKGIPVIQLSEKYDMTFVNKEAVMQLIEDGQNKLTREEVKGQLNIVDLPEYISRNQAKLYLGFTNKKFEQIIKLGLLKVETIESNGKTLYKKSQLVDFKKIQEIWEREFIKDHLIDLEVWERLGSNLPKDTLRSGGIFKLIELADKGYIEFVNLKYPLIFINEKKYENIKRFFTKSSIVNFLCNYIKLEEVMEKLGKSNLIDTNKFLKVNEVEVVKIGFKLELAYVNKFDFECLIEKKSKKITSEEKLQQDLEESEYLNRKQVMAYLNLTNKRIKQFLDTGLLRVEKKVHNNLTLFSKSKVIKLKEQQVKLLSIINEKWYTRNEVLEKYNYDPDAHDVRKTKVPVLVASDVKFLNKRIIYLKSSVEENYKRLQYNQQYYMDVGTIYDNVRHRLQMENFTFPNHLRETEKLWGIYIKSKSSEWNPNTYDDRLQRINIFVNLTKDMITFLTKEIFNCSSKELNIAFFNKKIQLHYQKHLYT